jgi:hypothetical protein
MKGYAMTQNITTHKLSPKDVFKINAADRNFYLVTNLVGTVDPKMPDVIAIECDESGVRKSGATEKRIKQTGDIILIKSSKPNAPARKPFLAKLGF